MGGGRSKKEYFDKFIGGLLVLGLVAPHEHGFVLTERGRHIRAARARKNAFSSRVEPAVARLFAIALMQEFRKTDFAAGQRAACLWHATWHTFAVQAALMPALSLVGEELVCLEER